MKNLINLQSESSTINSEQFRGYVDFPHTNGRNLEDIKNGIKLPKDV